MLTIVYQHQKNPLCTFPGPWKLDPSDPALRKPFSEIQRQAFHFPRQLQRQFCAFSCEASRLVFFPLGLLGVIFHSICRELANDMLISMCL